ncbi:hypothetical protein HPB49_022624 [Dermacentor silvarum]|uniref:Uncharacterized protein n=1 Tax=Dermacentor silvarum TaxID=543639 RepID=A0ACB8DRB7_DERSI|nr:hypothetical protein HPB49_022624 [Dermacentor silvarum]
MRELFRHWRILEWPVQSFEERHREDAWFFAGELLRDIGLAVFADIYVAVNPVNERRDVTTLRPPEPLYFPRDTPSDLVDRAVKETLRAFNLNDQKHVEHLADEIMMVFDVLERLAVYNQNATVLKD